MVTGGGRGIGRAIALAFAAEGAHLALASRTKAELEETADAIARQYESKVHTVVADVSNKLQVEKLVSSTAETFGAIDVLVNNAGNLGPVGSTLGKRPIRMGAHHCHPPIGHLLLLQGGYPSYASARERTNRKHGWSGRAKRDRLRCSENGYSQSYRESGSGVSRHGHHGECNEPRVYSHPHVGRDAGPGPGELATLQCTAREFRLLRARVHQSNERLSWRSFWEAILAVRSQDDWCKR